MSPALFVCGPKGSAPAAVKVLLNLHVPRPTADWAVFDIRLTFAATLVDKEVDRFTAVGTEQQQMYWHSVQIGIA